MSKQIKIIVRTVVRVNDSVLILKRNKSVNNSGKWEVPGGKLDFGESFEAAASRELAEETGIDAEPNDLLTTGSTVDGEYHILTLVYELLLGSKPKVHLSEEHDEYAWVEKSTLGSYSFVTNEYNNFFEDYLISESTIEHTTPVQQTETTKHDAVAIIYSDGGSRGNPGPSATGYVIYDEEENELARGGTYLGIATNNQAEYLAVKEGLVRAQELGLRNIQYFMDSMLVVKQMNGEYKIKNKDLWPIHQSIKDLSSEFDNVSFRHVRREKNKVADSIVNEVLDDHQK